VPVIPVTFMPERLYDAIIWDDPVTYLDASFVTKIEKSNRLGASLPVIVKTGKQARSVRSYLELTAANRFFLVWPKFSHPLKIGCDRDV
jgi:hypothetical protein